MHLEWKRGGHRILAGESQSVMLASQRSIGRYFGATGLLVLTCSVIMAVFYGRDSQRPLEGRTLQLKVTSSDQLTDTRPGIQNDPSAAPVTTVEPAPEPSLSDGEKEAFFHEIEVVFGSLSLVTLDPAVIAPHLSRLNERGPKGLTTLIALNVVRNALINSGSTVEEVETQIKQL